MQFGNGHTPLVEQGSFQDALLAQADSIQDRVDAAYRQLTRAQREIDNLKGYVTHLNGLLEAEGLPRVNIREPSAGTGFAAPGNRSSKVPPRKARFEGMSLMDAIEIVLEETRDETHADVLVETIYEISTPADKRYGKRSLVSSARSGAKAGRWTAIPGNKYRAKMTQAELVGTVN